jgi:mono/diheme cytochrome c family protein
VTKLVLAASACLAVTALAAPAAVADDIRNGAQLAQVWCASCHVIPGADGPALQGPPSFRAIAHSGKTPDQLRVFLEHPHGAMPQLSLSRAEIADLIAYIASLR